MKVKAEVDGRTISVEGEDVLAWDGHGATGNGADTEFARARAAAYVRANPRPDPDAQGGVNVPARQRMALLRRLAAGPASKLELLQAMRAAAGYVGGDDWRNRYDELRGHGKRGGGHLPLPIEHDELSDTYRLVESFAALSEVQRRMLGHAKAALDGLGAATIVLDGLLPDIAPPGRPAVDLDHVRGDVLTTLDAALDRNGVVELYHDDERRGTDAIVTGVPRAYVTAPHGLMLWIVHVDEKGARVGGGTVPVRGIQRVVLHPEIRPRPEILRAPTVPLRIRVDRGAARLCDELEALGLDVEPGPVGASGQVVLEGELNVDLAHEALDTLLVAEGPVTVLTPRWLAAGIGARSLRRFLAHVDPDAPGLPAAAVDGVRALLAALETRPPFDGDAAPPAGWLRS
ncbi:MAG: hypothetical protein KY469_11955 [Actinobacteria bacterium]|nr:hypothetical protein [Actinomycetota bacterium]